MLYEVNKRAVSLKTIDTYKAANDAATLALWMMQLSPACQAA
jgi:hypothetical protein